MTTIAKLIVSIIMALTLFSCNFDINFGPGVSGNGHVVTEERIVKDDFDKIEAHAGLDVYLTQNGKNSVTVEADENLQDMIMVYVENGILHLTVEGNIRFAESKKVMVSFGEIREIQSNSGSDVYGEGVIKSEDLTLTSTSGSDMEVEVITNNLSLNASSGADLKVNGKTNNLTADASSGSDIKAGNLISQTCLANASSGADITVNTKKELVASAGSGGDINYSGNPEKVKNLIHQRAILEAIS
ncbi:Putative auto-transporter adhesin, head GIN domain [Flavobacteriaceae bacterium MAR_2010_188]|nr:Putative auto-transporter adhesin, head GIN domain [Flavobacteriaceae bacterium MAR_2010_188]